MTEPAPDRVNGPLATLKRALEIMDSFDASAAGVLVISIHQGHYVIKKPVNIFRGSSGNDSLQLLIRSQPGDKVVLTTSMQLEGVRKLRDGAVSYTHLRAHET